MNDTPASHDLLSRQDDSRPSASGPEGRRGPLRPVPADALIVLPMRNAVLFPGVVAPLAVGRASSVAAVRAAVQGEQRVGFLLQRDAATDEVGPADLHWVGTAGRIVRHVAPQEGPHHLMVQGEQRFRVLEFLEGWPWLVARVAAVEEAADEGPETEARFLQLREKAVEAVSLMPQVPDELATVVQGVESPGLLADMVANLLDLRKEEKQEILETFSLRRRLDRVLDALAARVAVMKLSKEIGDKTRIEFDQRQKEHVLREQMRQIRKELGEDAEDEEQIDELAASLEKAGMPEETLAHARKELKRLKRMNENGAEAGMLRTWLEWMAELPWKPEAPRPIDLAEARRILDADHFGLEKVKKRIVEFLAVRKLKPEGRSPILCFVGPPGV
ncbi:MAG: LON peptidase substrate-binding domain-containing protein, partial [Betaproteobacteria bacterium]